MKAILIILTYLAVLGLAMLSGMFWTSFGRRLGWSYWQVLIIGVLSGMVIGVLGGNLLGVLL